MSRETDGSVTRWIEELKAGKTAAAQPLWNRYFDRLVRLARAKLRTTGRPSFVEDEEDAVLNAFDSFCRRATAGDFPQLSDREDLWRLLVTLTARKALDQAKREGAMRRGGKRVVAEADLMIDERDSPHGGLEHVVGTVPTPEFAAMIAEQYHLLLNALGDSTLKQVAVWKLEGYTNEQIAERLGCALRTVANRLKLIRLKWGAAGP